MPDISLCGDEYQVIKIKRIVKLKRLLIFSVYARNSSEIIVVTCLKLELIASLVRLALCDLVNDIISGLDPEEALDVGSGPVEDAACYINFCLENGIITQEQGLSIYMQIKQKIQLDLPFIAGITGLDVEVLKKMAQA